MVKCRVCVTGATGFVGRALISHFSGMVDVETIAIVRKKVSYSSAQVSAIYVGDIGADTDWSGTLRDCDVVIHLAARVHIMKDTSTDPLSEFRRMNVDATINLARQAVSAGVRRFVFLSSIKVNGEMSEKGRPFSADDIPHPQDSYGISKFEAETGLLKLAAETGLEVIIIRPPLIYGPGVQANFRSMMKWVYRGVPLPFGVTDNLRSLVAIDNLIGLIVVCLNHESAKNQVLLISDGEDLSTAQLLARVAGALGKTARLFPVPRPLLMAVGKLTGLGSFIDRLFGNLQVDISKTRQLLNWSPAVSVDSGLLKTAKAFIDETKL